MSGQMNPPRMPPITTSATRPIAPPPAEGGHTIRIDVTHPDDPARPMTRTELAMLWDLLNRWAISHPGRYLEDEHDISVAIDAELTERFGG